MVFVNLYYIMGRAPICSTKDPGALSTAKTLCSSKVYDGEIYQGSGLNYVCSGSRELGLAMRPSEGDRQVRQLR